MLYYLTAHRGTSNGNAEMLKSPSRTSTAASLSAAPQLYIIQTRCVDSIVLFDKKYTHILHFEHAVCIRNFFVGFSSVFISIDCEANNLFIQAAFNEKPKHLLRQRTARASFARRPCLIHFASPKCKLVQRCKQTSAVFLL